jgi:hypothetical protein
MAMRVLGLYLRTDSVKKEFYFISTTILYYLVIFRREIHIFHTCETLADDWQSLRKGSLAK